MKLHSWERARLGEALLDASIPARLRGVQPVNAERARLAAVTRPPGGCLPGGAYSRSAGRSCIGELGVAAGGYWLGSAGLLRFWIFCAVLAAVGNWKPSRLR